jgi:hypothetical protein
MAGTALVIADRPEAVIQQGQPPAQMAAWLLDIPDGQNAVQAAAAWVQTQNMPIGTIARVIDVTAAGAAMATFRLDSQWVAV